MNNEVFYVKPTKLSLPATGIKLVKIPVLESVQLNFYQKMIILLLKKGFSAADRHDLIERLSETLNVSDSCVEDFINYLVKEKNIVFNAQKKSYSLADGITYYVDKKRNNIMFAELDTKMADCDNLLFLDNFREICLDSAFRNNDLFRIKASNTSETSLNGIKTVLADCEEAVKAGIAECFSNTNYHLKNEFSYELANELRPYNIEFDALVTYKYSRIDKTANKIEVSLMKGNDIPGHIVDELAKSIQYDDELPRFIALEESFYEKSSLGSKTIDDDEENASKLEEVINPLKQELSEQKEELSRLEKEHKKALSTIEDARDRLNREVAEKEEKLRINNNLLTRYKKENASLASGFESAKKELEFQRAQLADELRKTMVEIDALRKKFEDTKKAQEENIRSLKGQLDEKDKELNNLVNQKKKSDEKTLENLVDTNRNHLDPKTKLIIDKYKNENSLFCRYVRDICIGIDKAISASDCEAFDETMIVIQEIRAKYITTVKVVFDTLFEREAPSLADYFGSAQKQLKLERLFRENHSSTGVMKRFIQYHELSNALSHIQDNNQKTEKNKEVIDDFKDSKATERRDILYALPDFFLDFSFTAQQKKTFSAKMKV